MTRVIEYVEDKKTIVCDNTNKGLDAFDGDPVAILESSRKVTFGLVTEATEASIVVQFAKDVEVRAGAIVQNLRNRLFMPGGQIGITSRMCQPDGLGLVSHTSRDGVLVMVTPPLNPGRVDCFDIYARDKPFDAIDPFWWPDSFDNNIRVDQVQITTFNGGPTAGGGVMKPGKTYWITAIAKDRKGFCNVNESTAQFVEKVKLQD